MTILVVLPLMVLGAYAVYHSLKRAKKGSACCGEKTETLRRMGPKDKVKSHYAHSVSFCVTGMTCENCAIRVENALNGLDGVYAKVDISTKKAKLLLMQEPDWALLQKTIHAIGYGMEEKDCIFGQK